MSEDLLIKATEDTPEINFNRQQGILKISGRSLPEDAFSFYEPIHQWLKQYTLQEPDKTECTFNLEYFNTASAKQIFKIIQSLCDLSKSHHVQVIWQYDEGDKDMSASGLRFSKLCGIDVEIRQN
jgi:hypothetical protein